MIHSVWSKTTLITGGVDGVGELPPTCKMGTFFLGPWLLNSVPIYRNFESNGAKWRSLKLRKKGYCDEIRVQKDCLIFGQLAIFDWKFL